MGVGGCFRGCFCGKYLQFISVFALFEVIWPSNYRFSSYQWKAVTMYAIEKKFEIEMKLRKVKHCNCMQTVQ